MNGLLIALEGIDGAGKTTQAQLLMAALKAWGHDVLCTKEPTNGQWGRRLRESATTGRLAPDAELELFIKDRREHVELELAPSLAAGKVVLIDRYYFSTVAYQGARGMDPAQLLAINEAFAPPPDLLVLLEVVPRVGLERIAKRGDKANAFEAESSLEAVARVFRTLDFPYLLRIDANLAPDAITQKILGAPQLARLRP